jgi:hypothetical protein
MNDFLRSFEGQTSGSTKNNDTDESEGGVFWKPMFGIDRELEKIFRDVGRRTADICFVDSYTNLIINNEKLRMHSNKAAHSSLLRHKSP